MFADKKAHAIGDILTVVIKENNGATRAQQHHDRQDDFRERQHHQFSLRPAASGLLTKGGQYPAMKYNSDMNSPAAARSTTPKPSPPRWPCA